MGTALPWPWRRRSPTGYFRLPSLRRRAQTGREPLLFASRTRLQTMSDVENAQLMAGVGMAKNLVTAGLQSGQVTELKDWVRGRS